MGCQDKLTVWKIHKNLQHVKCHIKVRKNEILIKVRFFETCVLHLHIFTNSVISLADTSDRKKISMMYDR